MPGKRMTKEIEFILLKKSSPGDSWKEGISPRLENMRAIPGTKEYSLVSHQREQAERNPIFIGHSANK
jgi:hypothetical protein